MTVVDSGSSFWDRRTKIPFDQAKFDPETRDLLRRAIFVKPLPFVKEVVFIATPHRGSYMASNFVVKFANKFLNLPGGLGKPAAPHYEPTRPPDVRNTLRIPASLDQR